MYRRINRWFYEKKPKLNCLTVRFAVSLLIAGYFAGISMAKAQKAVYIKPMK